MYRLILETLLGVHLEVDHLRIAPCIPDNWASYKIHYRYRETIYHITVKCVGEKPEKVVCVKVDGAVLNGESMSGSRRESRVLIPLSDDRQEHTVDVDLG